MTKEFKQEIMQKYARTANDTGSPEVQIALNRALTYTQKRPPLTSWIIPYDR